MKWIVSTAGIIMLICMTQVCRGQELITISDPRLELRDNIVYISYDILNSERDVDYTVRLEVTDSTGRQIPASSLAGDIGEGISGGRRKQITWDLSADSIFIDADIFITVYANEVRVVEPEEAKEPEEVIAENQPAGGVQEQVADDQEQTQPQTEDIAETGQEVVDQEQVQQPQTEDDAETEPVTGDEEETASKGFTPVPEASLEEQGYNRTWIILQSLAVPGLGLSRVKGKPHWLRGVAAYGCVAGSVLYWNRANGSLNDSNAAERDDWKTYYHDVADWQRQISMTLAASAAAVWISDFVWTMIGTSGPGKNRITPGAGWRIISGIEPRSSLPTLGIRFRF